MAINQTHDTAWDALVDQAAAEVRGSNPHIGESRQPYPDDEYAELVEDAQQLAVVWDEIDRLRERKPHMYTAADAVDEDRGE